MEKFLDKVKDKELEYEGCHHIAFTLMSREVAAELARVTNLPVFYLG